MGPNFTFIEMIISDVSIATMYNVTVYIYTSICLHVYSITVHRMEYSDLSMSFRYKERLPFHVYNDKNTSDTIVYILFA